MQSVRAAARSRPTPTRKTATRSLFCCAAVSGRCLWSHVSKSSLSDVMKLQKKKKKKSLNKRSNGLKAYC